MLSRATLLVVLVFLLSPGLGLAIQRERGWDGRYFRPVPMERLSLADPPPGTFTPTGPVEAVLSGDWTITFDNVTGSGFTNAVGKGELPQVGAAAYPAFSTSWDISTTATVTGTITLQLAYRDTGLTPDQEAALTLVQWDGTQWAPLTTAVDSTNKLLQSQCTALGTFSVMLPWPSLPTLTGKLAYTAWNHGFGGGDTMAYSVDPQARVALAPGAMQGKWYPDGLGLVYRTDDGIVLNALDGKQPVLVPLLKIWDPSLSPDEKSLLYTQILDPITGTSSPRVWTGATRLRSAIPPRKSVSRNGRPTGTGSPIENWRPKAAPMASGSSIPMGRKISR